MRQDAIQAEIRRMMDEAHPEKTEIERDHETTMLTQKAMVQAIPGEVLEVRAVHPIGKHSICEFVEKRGPISRLAYAALEAL